MSKDLLAELDSFYQPSNVQKASQQPGASLIASLEPASFAPHTTSQTTDPELEEWGDFEDAERPGKTLAGGNRGFDGPTSTQSTKPVRQKLDDNVLFDADFPEDGDDFGDFEGGEYADLTVTAGDSQAATGTSQAWMKQSSNLVDLDFGDTDTQTQKREDPWQAESKVSSFRISTPAEPDRFIKKNDTTAQAPESNARDGKASHDKDNWSGFDDWMEGPGSSTADQKSAIRTDSNIHREVVAPRKRILETKRGTDTTHEPSAGKSTQDEAWDDFEEQAPPTSTRELNPVLSSIPTILPEPPNGVSALPPTNIPPPSLVFTLFAPVINEAQQSFFSPLSALAPAAKTEALSHTTSQTFVRSYIALGVVAARTITGRKLRWKRDTRLSQGMRIGAAGGKGMKLAGVDKSELAKEDREVAELVRVWNAQVGRLRAVVAPTKNLVEKAGGVALGTVPDLKTVMPVVAAKEAEGAVPSQRPCALCGLKREERVAGIEKGDVGDVFGEWWVESASMHRSCRNFWEARSGELRTR